MSDRNDQLDRQLGAMKDALLAIANYGDCDYALDSERPRPCPCPQCRAQRALDTEDNWRLEGARFAITRLLASFSREMNKKLIAKVDTGRGGWADEDWTVDDIKKALVEHIERGDPVDVANFCAFWWNRLGGDQ